MEGEHIMTKAEYSQRTHVRAHSWDTYGKEQHNEHIMCRIRHLTCPDTLGMALERELAELNWALDCAFSQAGDQLELPLFTS
jgi:hypothetical protein